MSVAAGPAEAPDPGDRPLALVLVRNAVTHDNRVLREVQTLTGCGYRVLVAGVVSTAEPRPRARVGGAEVIRLDPRAGWPLRRARPVPSGGAAEGGAAGGAADGAAGGAAGGAADGAVGTGEAVAGAPATPRRGAAAVVTGRLRRLAVTAGYYRRAIGLCRATAPVLVHANDYNTMWIAVAAKLLCSSRVVYDCHELWADRNGRPEWRMWLVACEALFVRAADVTITASPGYAAAMARRYRVPAPAVVRNIPATALGAVPMVAATPAGPLGGDAGLALYVGGLMPGRGLEEGMRALALAPGLRMRLVGPGGDGYRAALHRLAGELGIAGRLEISAPVAPGDVVTAIAGADLGLMLIQPVCRSYELTLPNKLFEYAAAGLPILASDLPVIGPIVRDEGLGAVVSPRDPAAIAAAMESLAAPERNRDTRARVRAFAAANPWEGERAGLAAAYGRAGAAGATAHPPHRHHDARC